MKKFVVASMGILFVLVTGCQISDQVSEETVTYSPPPQNQQSFQTEITPDNDALLLKDDFSDEKSGWYTGGDEEIKYYYANGEYFVMATKSDNFFHSNTNDNFRNIILNIDLRHISGDDSLTGGMVVWRYKDNQTFYGLTISDDGTYAIHRYYSGEYQLVKIRSYSDFLKKSGETNHITIVTLNDHNDIYFNDHFEYRFDDAAISSGSVGLGVFPDPSSAVQVAFDNLEIYEYHSDNSHTPEKPILTPTPVYQAITWEELVQFLADDHTNWNKYDLTTYNCLDFAIDLVKNANQQNIKARIVAVNFSNQDIGHAFVEFETSDHGSIFVEPQGDNTYSNVRIGNPLCDDWNQFDCMGVIASIDYFSECNHLHECSILLP